MKPPDAETMAERGVELDWGRRGEALGPGKDIDPDIPDQHGTVYPARNSWPTTKLGRSVWMLCRAAYSSLPWPPNPLHT